MLDPDKLKEALEKLPLEQQQELLALLSQYEEARTREVAQEDFLGFVRKMWPSFIYGRHFKIMAEKFEAIAEGKIKRLIINMPPRHGKLLENQTLTLTPSGWREHGSLQVGDQVYHPSGRQVTVIGVSPEAEATVLVKLGNGEEIWCHPNHEWTFYDRTISDWRTEEARWFYEPTRLGKSRKLWNGERGKRGGRCNFQLPNVQPLQMVEASLPIEPYWFGLWLGDGVSIEPRLTMCRKDLEVVKAAIGYSVSAENVHPQTGVVSCGFAGQGIRSHLRALGALNNKHIPACYKFSSIEQRAALIAGLIDSDGHVDKQGRVRIATCSKQLCDDIVEVLTTLAQRPYVMIQEPTTSTSGIEGKQRVYYVGFQPSISFPTQLSRKKIKPQPQLQVGIAEVTYHPDSDRRGKCIQVSSPDGLYLVGKTLVPTHNSEFTSWLLPAWYIGRFPDRKVIQASHTADLSKDFGRKVRDLIADSNYASVFPSVSLKADSKAAGRWMTNYGGEYFAVGVGGAMAGKGAHLLIIDDPHNEQEAQTADPAAFDHVYDWYHAGPRQRLQPGAAICIVMTRWSQRDLTGRIIKAAQQRGDVNDWHVIEFPMCLPSGKVLWPEYWSQEEMEALRNELPYNRWMAQYQQQPTSEGAAIVKREWWRRWSEPTPPQCEFVIQTWDTAYYAKAKSDFSACTTWGVFYHPDSAGKMQANVILLDAFKDRLEFPALKKKALELYQDMKPDAFLIEMKATGAPLVFELRAMGIPVGEHHVSRGRSKGTGESNDKVTRLNAVADMFQSGMVWAPDRRFADEVIEEFAAFPRGEHDDYVDAGVIALERFRRGGFLRLASDDDDDEPMRRVRRADYY